MNCDMLAQFAIDFGLKEPSAFGNVINTIINEQNVDGLKICSTCKSALDKIKINSSLVCL